MEVGQPLDAQKAQQVMPQQLPERPLQLRKAKNQESLVVKAMRRRMRAAGHSSNPKWRRRRGKLAAAAAAAAAMAEAGPCSCESAAAQGESAASSSRPTPSGDGSTDSGNADAAARSGSVGGAQPSAESGSSTSARPGSPLCPAQNGSSGASALPPQLGARLDPASSSGSSLLTKPDPLPAMSSSHVRQSSGAPAAAALAPLGSDHRAACTPHSSSLLRRPGNRALGSASSSGSKELQTLHKVTLHRSEYCMFLQ